MPFTRFVIVHPEWGIYLGSCVGLGFWSQLDPVGQTHAVTFESIEEARTHIMSWDENNNPKLYKFVKVESAEESFISVDECIKEGLPGWKQDAQQQD